MQPVMSKYQQMNDAHALALLPLTVGFETTDRNKGAMLISQWPVELAHTLVARCSLWSAMENSTAFCTHKTANPSTWPSVVASAGGAGAGLALEASVLAI